MSDSPQNEAQDNADLPAGLLAWLSEEFSGNITRMERHVARREAWVVDITQSDGSVIEGFLRIDRAPRENSTVSLRREAEICRVLPELGIPVPALLGWNEPHHAALFSRVQGRADIHNLKDTEQQRKVMEDFIDIIARLHQIDAGSLGIDEHLGDKPDTPARCALDDLDRQLSSFASFVEHYVDPLMTYSVQWLRRHVPKQVDRVCLVQGDTGPVNFMFEGNKVTAIVDWEWGHWGDPMEDLGNICVRELWNPSGGLTGLFKRYEQASGIPYNRFAAQYYRIQQNVRGMIPIHAACKHMPPGQSYAWYLCYRYLGDRTTCEALADAMDIAIERPSMPDDSKKSVISRAAVAHIHSDIMPAVDTPIAQSRADDIVILIECMERQQRFGDQLKSIECQEISQLLDTQINDFNSALKQLNDAILAERLDDKALIPYLARKAYRDEWLHWPVTRLYPDRVWSALD